MKNVKKGWFHALGLVALMTFLAVAFMPLNVQANQEPTTEEVDYYEEVYATEEVDYYEEAEYDEQPIIEVAIGDIMFFGNYEWLVLDVQENQVLIIANNTIGHRRYHHTFGEGVTWEISEIREYLNYIFFYTFSEEDRARILETTVINTNNPWNWLDMHGYVSTPGGNNTTDRIFLLSIDEVLRYFGDSGMVAQGAAMSAKERRTGFTEFSDWATYVVSRWRIRLEQFIAVSIEVQEEYGPDDQWIRLVQRLVVVRREEYRPTRPGVGGIDDQYSKLRIAMNYAGSASGWWLRSPGRTPNDAIIVFSTGYIHIIGNNTFINSSGVRPALWLSLE